MMLFDWKKYLFKKPAPIPDERWKWFKGCLGAIDGTHISVHVPEEDKPRYRNRKGEITTNVLAACTPDMQFIYVLPGWEGSADDGRILRSAMIRENGLQVNKGNYYLVDADINGEGFLAPFRGQRYHLNTWLNGHRPEKAEEYFNMKHTQPQGNSWNLSMESQLPGGKGPEKNKRKWNEIEDEKLVETMPGFFGAVETRLAASLPNSGLKAKPHIELRIKTLKSDWSAVHDMMSWNNTSGFGWDYENHMLDAPQFVWQAYAQVHKNAAKWRVKKFPHYWDLCLVFGKDRANGRDAQTAADVVSEINNEQEETGDFAEATGDGLEDIDVDAPLNSPSNALSREESSAKKKRRENEAPVWIW